MKSRLTAIAIVSTFLSASVFVPTVSAFTSEANRQVVAQRPTSTALQNQAVTLTLPDGTTRSANVTVTQFGYDRNSGQLLANGTIDLGTQVVNGQVTRLVESFENVPATLTAGSNQKQVGSCDILFLDLGPIFLDLLGLQVDLSQIVLDIDAVTGAGNLLGNLLCALVGLLDGGPFAGIIRIIDQINAILGSITG